jgi:LuxR family maltose regulon positive regulatory protein
MPSILKTRLSPPVEPGALVNRTRLEQRFKQVEFTRLTVIQAPAGYGKTCALSQCYHWLKAQQKAVAWLNASSSDRDAVELLNYVAEALNCTADALKTSSRVDNHLFDTKESLINYIIDRLEQRTESVYLFIDDMHLLTAAPMTAICQLIERSPANLHFIIASRTIPDLHLARTRARGELLEIGAEELIFTRDETQHYMANTTELSAADLDMLQQRTEGWIAGIKLVCLALRRDGLPAMEMLNAFTGNQRSVSDFFAEEVISSLPKRIADFLMKTSILEQLSPELCDAVTGDNNARQLLNEIEVSGLFLVQLDNERKWYRYHHLFAEFLQRRLKETDPQLHFELYQCASQWCWQNQHYDDAIEYALHGPSPERAVKLLEQRCQDMTYTGKFQLVNKFVAQMPRQLLEQYPRIQLTLAWLAIRNLKFDETRYLLANVRTIIAENELAKTASADELQQLRYLLLHREMTLAAAEDKAAEVEKHCHTLLDKFPHERHPYLYGNIHAQLLYARREQYKLNDIEQLQAMAQGILKRSDYTFASIALQASIGPSLFFSGRSDAARRSLEQGLAEGIRYGGSHSSLASLPALPLAEIAYESNEIDRAQQLVESTLPYCTEMGFVDQLMPGFLTLARIRYSKGDNSAAFQVLEDGISLATERKLERLRLSLAGERCRLLIHSGLTDQAVQYASNANIVAPPEALLPNGKSTSIDEIRAVNWLRIELCEERTLEAINVAKHWRRFCTAHGAIRSLIRWDTLLAQLHFIAGDHRAAQRVLREALSHAASNRILRSFIDEGPAIHTLLASATTTTQPDSQLATDSFAEEILQLLNSRGKPSPVRPNAATQEDGLYGKLTNREREILSLVGAGMRNKEVALKMGMTEGSVKWYMQQIYDKLGTRRRLQAVERARQFGLIG